MNKIGAWVVAASLGVVLLTAAACPGNGGTSVTGTVNDISGPPLAERLGCKNGTWSITVDPDGQRGKSIEERAKLRKQVCVSAEQAKKYVPGSRYP